MFGFNLAYIHIVLNHIPIIMNGAGLLVLLTGMVWRNDAVVKAALVLFIASAVICIPTFLTGDGAADVVKTMDAVNVRAIRPHDQAAGWALWTMCIEGIAAIALWIAYRGPKIFPRWAQITVLVLALLSASTGIRTALLGGKIRHPEGDIPASQVTHASRPAR